jgi:type IV pilus assembly protein PilO
MDLKQLNELDFSNIGEWPGFVKAFVVLLLCAGVAGAWYYYDTREQIDRLRGVEKTEVTLRAEFESKQQKAANLDAYRQQLEEMKESFGAMLRQLPDKTEVAALLVDVSQTGLAAGLEFELFQPAEEHTKDFYAELPIQVRVTGRYHDFGRFISGLAGLPRIVTIHDVGIDSGAAKSADDTLKLKAIVKTYRYLEEFETQDSGNKAESAKKKVSAK